MLTTETGKAEMRRVRLCRPSVGELHQLVPGEDEEGNRYPLVFEIDEFRCIFCGYSRKSVRRKRSTLDGL